ncbi:transcriptional regulator, tetr family [hydrocarbon metagenome]|uniref:Transcriptional regulator, tetr family n=1 Tax=hydrocarbon metagenome TaxID=938273 RepID=A0A0W8E111_9ZZZZ
MKDIIEKTENKRERILLAAIEVFTCRGYNSARMEEIAETAGIGKGTLYEYFDSKLQLFNAMIIRSWEEYSNSVTADSITELSFEETIRETIKGHFTFSKEKKKLARILFWDTEIMDEDLKEWMYKNRKNQERLIEKIVNKAVAAGEIKPVDNTLVFIILAGLIGSIWSINILENWEIDPEDLADQLTDAVMNGIRK